MDLINYLPEGSTFRKAFKPWTDDKNSTRLVLAIPHCVSTQWGISEVSGSADITYVVQGKVLVPEVEKSLDISHVQHIGIQSPDLIRGMMDTLRPRMSYSFSTVSTGLYDMRAACYVIGAVLGATASGGSIRLGPASSVRTLSPTWTVPTVNEVTLAPGVARTPREFATLLKIFGSAGTKIVQVISDTIPTTSARCLTGGDLCSYALKLAMIVVSGAQNCGCADHHMLALFRGMNHSLSLWAHSDEGGWVRKALAKATYPASAGVVSVETDTFLNLSTKDNLQGGHAPRVVFAMFLSMVGVWTTSDPCPNGKPLVLEKRDGLARPSNVDGLEDATYSVARNFRHRVCELYDLHMSRVADSHSFSTFFAVDKVDSHLEGKYIVPFFWVEPGALVTSAVAGYELPVILGTAVALPLSNKSKIYKPGHLPEVAGRVFGGCKVIVKQLEPSVRMSGMSYIMSSRYRKENGLSRVEYVTRPDLGTFTTDVAFVTPGETNGAQRRWVTPHNPVPSPSEGMSTYPLTMEYLYSGSGKEPLLTDWADGVVHSGLGLFRVVTRAEPISNVTHRHVPPWLDSYVKSFNNSRPLMDMSILSEYVTSTPPDPVEGIDHPLTQASEFSPDGETTKIHQLPDGPPLTNEVAEEVNVVVSNTAGSRPDLPKVPVEDESPGGDSDAPS